MTGILEQEQEQNKARRQEITLTLHEANSRDSDVCQFIKEIRQYSIITELDEVILNRLIDKVFISVVEEIDGEKVQKVEIFYNLVDDITK